MEDTCQTLTITANNNRHLRRGRRLNGDEANGFDCDDEEDDDGEECDKEVWNVLSKSFRLVQSVLDRNRLLIHQVDENHQSKIPENLVKNVALIREISGNISKIVSLYSDLSSNFSNIVRQRRAILASNIDDHHNMEKTNIAWIIDSFKLYLGWWRC
nr:early flowering 4-like 10 [Diospyros sp. 'deyangshi']